MSPFEAARKLLSMEMTRMSLGDRSDLVFQDADLVPLLLQVGYFLGFRVCGLGLWAAYRGVPGQFCPPGRRPRAAAATGGWLLGFVGFVGRMSWSNFVFQDADLVLAAPAGGLLLGFLGFGLWLCAACRGATAPTSFSRTPTSCSCRWVEMRLRVCSLGLWAACR